MSGALVAQLTAVRAASELLPNLRFRLIGFLRDRALFSGGGVAFVCAVEDVVLRWMSGLQRAIVE